MRTFVLLELVALALAYLVVTQTRLRPLPGLFATAAFTLLALLSAAWSPHVGLTVDRAVGFAALVVAAAALAFGATDRPRVAGGLMLALVAATTLIAVAGLFELWHAYDQAVLPATTGQGGALQRHRPEPEPDPDADCAGPAVRALGRAGVGRPPARCGGGRRAAVGRLARRIRLARRVDRGVRRLPRLRARGRAATAQAGLRRRGRALRRRDSSRCSCHSPRRTNPDLYGTFGRTPKLGPKDLNNELPLESEFGFPGESVETGKTRTLFFTSGRLQAWETAIQQGLDRPIAGYGFGTEDETFVDRSYLFVSRAVENSFIGVFLQLGAMGLALLVVALVLPLVAWWRVRNALDPERKEYAAACAGVVVAGLVLAVPQSYLTSVGSPPTAAFWIAFFLLAALTVGPWARPGRWERRSAQAGSTRG